MSESALLVERRERVAILTMNRPEKLNALNKELQDCIIEACGEIRNDDDIWAVIITGAGRGFSAGADLSGGRPPVSDEQAPRQQRLDVSGWVGRLATAVYRVAIQGWSKEDALAEMTDGGFGFHEDFQNLLEYVRELDVDEIKRRAGMSSLSKEQIASSE